MAAIDTNVEFLVHLEPAPESGQVWWAETAAVPGLSVAAESLQELFVLALEAVGRELGPAARFGVRFDLVPEAPATASLSSDPSAGDPLEVGPTSEGISARLAILSPA